MTYRFEIFYQEKEGTPHIKIENQNLVANKGLSEYVGWTLADRILQKATNRMMFRETPEVRAFFENGGRQVILSDMTNHGNVYIEAVEVE